MSTVHADIAVIGAELCGLAAGAALAHAGHRIVVIDDDDPGDIRDLGGIPAPIAPALWRMPSNGPSVTLLDKLGLRQDAKRALGEPEGLGVVDDPDVRMVFPLDEAPRAREFSRVFGNDALSGRLEAIDYAAGISLLSEALTLHDDGFFGRRRERKRLDELGNGANPAAPALRKFIGDEVGGVGGILPYLAPFVVYDAAPDSTSIAGLLALARLGRGTLGGCDDGLGARAALRRLFRRVIAGHGGDVVETMKVKSLDVSGKKVTTINTDGKNQYAVRAIIDGTRDRSLVERLPAGKLREKSAALRNAVEVKRTGIVRRWLLPRNALPRGTSSRLLLLPTNDCPAVIVGIFEAGKAASDVEGRKAKPKSDEHANNVFVVATTFENTPSSSASLLERLDTRLDAQFPFAKAAALAVDDIDASEMQKTLPAYHCAAPAHALGGRRPRDAVANWARAGRDLTPRFGIEGELASAQSVAALIETMVEKK